VLLLLLCGCAGSHVDKPATAPEPLSAELVHLEDDRLHLDVAETPWGIRGLTSGANALEPELRFGHWLVLVYSVNDIQCVRLAYRSPYYAQQLYGKCRVALRPTHGFEDLKPWVSDPEAADPYGAGAPRWLYFVDGRLLRWEAGYLTDEQIVEFILIPGYIPRRSRSH
jgi:hypothetical protein